MKTTKYFSSFLVLAAMVFLCSAAYTQTQEKRELITVKSAQESNGVVIIEGQGEKAPLELQCNKDILSCVSLKAGQYVMVRLPRNRGMYDCANVTVYAKTADSATLGEELGGYCVNEK